MPVPRPHREPFLEGIFRILLQARDLSESRRFYEVLLGTKGRLVAPGRIYFDVGPVILGVLDYSRAGAAERQTPTESVYVATNELERMHERARRLRCLSTENLHDDADQPMGSIVVRPWGERSFYAQDPSGNPLCFVDAATIFTGSPDQIAALSARGPARKRAPRRARARASRTRA